LHGGEHKKGVQGKVSASSCVAARTSKVVHDTVVYMKKEESQGIRNFTEANIQVLKMNRVVHGSRSSERTVHAMDREQNLLHLQRVR